jgi:DNA-binding NarL/FixJ family response regulator
MAIRILLVDDHRILRQGLAALLKAHGTDIEVLEADNGRSAVRMAETELPDVVVMDLSMPELNGIDATRQIVAGNPKVKVVALSAHSDRARIAEVFKAGASAYLPKDAAFEELSAAVRAVMADQVYLSRQVADTLIDSQIRGTESGPGLPTGPTGVYDRLTPREREVLQLIAEGKATKEVAALLRVSVKTAETHRRSIMEKLNLDSVAELTKYALREGLTSLDV